MRCIADGHCGCLCNNCSLHGNDEICHICPGVPQFGSSVGGRAGLEVWRGGGEEVYMGGEGRRRREEVGRGGGEEVVRGGGEEVGRGGGEGLEVGRDVELTGSCSLLLLELAPDLLGAGESPSATA